MEIAFSGTKKEINRKGKRYEFGPLPVVLEQKTVFPEGGHEELLHWHDELEIIRIRSGDNDADACGLRAFHGCGQ